MAKNLKNQILSATEQREMERILERQSKVNVLKPAPKTVQPVRYNRELDQRRVRASEYFIETN